MWTGADDTVLLKAEGSWSVYDLEDGEVLEPVEGQMFPCYSPSELVALAKASIPVGIPADYAPTDLYGGCLLNGKRITDPTIQDPARTQCDRNAGVRERDQRAQTINPPPSSPIGSKLAGYPSS